MTPILRNAFAVVTLLALLLAPTPSYAWGNTGHEAVAFVGPPMIEHKALPLDRRKNSPNLPS